MKTVTDVEAANIPVIDLNLLTSQRKELVQKLGEGLRKTGFVAVKNHGIDPSVFEWNYKKLAEVFALPKEIKLKYARPEIGHQRGYMPLEGETHPNSKAMDIKECYQTGDGINNTNIFPEEVSGFRDANEFLYCSMANLSVTILMLLDEYLEADGYLESLVLKPFPKNKKGEGTYIGTNLMRSIYYPAIENPEFNEEGFIIRGESHVDLNLITLLPVASKPGLQIMKRDGNWLTIDVPSGYIIVNAADMLHLITKGTNKEIPSTPHRIIADEELAREARFSIPFFAHPNHNLPLINLETKRPAIAANGQAMDQAAMYVYWRLKCILKSTNMPDYKTWKKENDPFIVDV